MMLDEPDIKPDALSSIAAPTLVIAAEKDMIKMEETKLIASSIPDSSLRMVKGATHDSYIVHSDALSDLVNEFFSHGN